jgi:hypothetical protein
MALAQQRHPCIGLNKFKPTKKDGSPNIDIFQIHAVKMQLVEPLKDGAGNLVKDAKGMPQVKIIPNEMIFEMWHSLWLQFVDIMEPIPDDPTVNAVPAEEDLMGDSAASGSSGFKRIKPVKTLPQGVDPTTLVWSIKKVALTDEELKSMKNSNIKFRYVLDFSDKITLSPAHIPAPAPALPSFAEMFPPVKDSEIQEYIDRWKTLGFDTGAAQTQATGAAPQGPQGSLPAGAIPPAPPTAPAGAVAASAPVGDDEQPF